MPARRSVRHLEGTALVSSSEFMNRSLLCLRGPRKEGTRLCDAPELVTRYPLPATHNLTTLADLMLGFFKMESSTSVEGDESRFRTVRASPPT